MNVNPLVLPDNLIMTMFSRFKANEQIHQENFGKRQITNSY